jgi:hypothetical protein
MRDLPPLRLVALAATFAVLSYANLSPANANAATCDTHEGQRTASIEKLDQTRNNELGKLRFSPNANLYVGAGNISNVQGIANPSTSYAVVVTQQDDNVQFAFHDKSGHYGTLTLLKPDSIFIFEVDPRDPQRGHTPIKLYKEWRVTASVEGKGIFSDGISPTQQLTLIVQGRGKGCTTAADFKAWTLVMQGPNANYQFFGQLLPVR